MYLKGKGKREEAGERSTATIRYNRSYYSPEWLGGFQTSLDLARRQDRRVLATYSRTNCGADRNKNLVPERMSPVESVTRKRGGGERNSNLGVGKGALNRAGAAFSDGLGCQTVAEGGTKLGQRHYPAI
ncbi:uncharacterized protein B0T23DRAFT_407421 [Neurospora hispaniola]|uniref:Uncharacterized protein n=1 Tax=Neurospora hispaniola TaxID=588809 RepID=A0AAJ0I0H9_9PEZI|nr:hypothetical protein B0T23DRAFT_407421 [Neurospora hispaniola]